MNSDYSYRRSTSQTHKAGDFLDSSFCSFTRRPHPHPPHLRRAKDIGINGLGRRYQLVSHHSSTSCSTWRSLHLSSLLSVHRGPSLPAVLRRARMFRGTLSFVHFENWSRDEVIIGAIEFLSNSIDCYQSPRRKVS